MNDTEALKNYVRAEDGALQWTLRGASQHVYATIYEFALTSQIWQGRAWTHRLQLFVPHTPHATKPDSDMPMVVNSAADAVLLYITTQGGSAETELGVQACAATGIACAFLYDVPNQPLFEGLMEDALIAHTFVRYLETEDATWPLLFPMVKSVTRAMDALQAFSREASNAKTVPNTANATVQNTALVPFTRFLITGASKRGWTSWLTAVAEAETGRVAAIAPMVYDNLNLLAQMPHQREVTGGYSASIHDYTELDLQARMATPEGAQLAQMVDPYTYLDRLTLPKLIINGANDSVLDDRCAQSLLARPARAQARFVRAEHGPLFGRYRPRVCHARRLRARGCGRRRPARARSERDGDGEFCYHQRRKHNRRCASLGCLFRFPRFSGRVLEIANTYATWQRGGMDNDGSQTFRWFHGAIRRIRLCV